MSGPIVEAVKKAIRVGLESSWYVLRDDIDTNTVIKHGHARFADEAVPLIDRDCQWEVRRRA